MKIRTGFVSNSSSSSFILLLPENFKETIDYDKIVDGDTKFPLDSFKRLINDLVNSEGMWRESIYDYSDFGYKFIDILDNLVRPYVIADVEGGPGDGQYIVANRSTIMKLLEK